MPKNVQGISRYTDKNYRYACASLHIYIYIHTYIRTYIHTYKEAILMYPNPANQSVTIDLSQSTENLSEIVFFDIVGKKVKVTNALGENQISIDVSDLSKGVYLIEIQTENKIKTTKKLMVQ